MELIFFIFSLCWCWDETWPKAVFIRLTEKEKIADNTCERQLLQGYYTWLHKRLFTAGSNHSCGCFSASGDITPSYVSDKTIWRSKLGSWNTSANIQFIFNQKQENGGEFSSTRPLLNSMDEKLLLAEY